MVNDGYNQNAVVYNYDATNNAFYKAWDPISRERDTFQSWMERHILGTEDFEGFKRSLQEAATYA